MKHRDRRRTALLLVTEALTWWAVYCYLRQPRAVRMYVLLAVRGTAATVAEQAGRLALTAEHAYYQETP